MFNDLIGKNKELGKFLFCERYTLQPVKNALRIAEGQELKRGAVVDVNGYLIGTKSIVPYAVLEFDCDTRDGGKYASVFTMGEFNFDKLTFGEGLSKNDIDNIVYNGNKVGIVIKPYEYSEGFNPAMANTSVSKENPLMNREETERMIAAMKPIADMTLRFEFSKKDYNPETAGVGSAGTWAKVDSPTLNVWDWTNENTDWSEAFKGAFTATDNEASVIAAGDTSSVTTIYSMFAGVYTGTPQSGYSLTKRNNLIKCVNFDTTGCISANSMRLIFIGSALKNIDIDLSKISEGGSVYASFHDTLIEEVGDIDVGNSDAITALFGRCKNLKSVGKIKISSNCYATIGIFNSCKKLETFGGFVGDTSGLLTFQTCFQQCNELKHIGIAIDASASTGLTDCQAVFASCYKLDEIPIKNITSSVTGMYATFNACRSAKRLPDIDVSMVTDFRSTCSGMYSLEEIPDLDVSSATNVNSMFKNCYKVKTGILEMYNKLLARGASITNHTDCFLNCGIDTPEGRAALAQIPKSWGGLAEG